MNLNLKIRHTVNGDVVCFKHAVQAALSDLTVEEEVDDFGQSGDMRHTTCDWCFDGVPLYVSAFKKPV